MKKTIIAMLALGGVAFGVTPTPVEQSITLDGTQATDSRLDMKYSTNANQTIKTTVDSVTISGVDGYGLYTANASLTFDIQNSLNATSVIKLPTTSASAEVKVKTTISAAELEAIDTECATSRWVVTADIFENIEGLVTNNHISVTLGGLTGFRDGGIIFDYNGTYYAASDITFTDGKYASVKANSTALELNDKAVYTALKITAASGASVKGIGFVASVPEPTTATLSLLALAGLAARRRRR